jgi:hypothetical protein
MWVAGAAIVMCLSLGGLAVGQSPPVSPPAEAGFAAVTATSDCSETIEDGTPQMETLPFGVTGLVLGCDNIASDPRVSGQGTMSLNIETWDPVVRTGPGTNMVLWGDVSITGPDGSWSGRQYGIYDSEGTVHVFGVLAGSGGYEGWSYATSGTVPGPTGNTTSESVGLIYHSPPPPGYPVEPLPAAPASE